MKTVRVPADTERRQALASDPARSAWVSANAGSGKTTVLAQRVIKTMLDGTPPERLLCLTFTKAAAANMTNRVFADLARFVTLDDAALDAELMRLRGRSGPGLRRAARQLFARALETPGGLKVQTIHAFCERVLQLFPFEADVPARFTVVDDAAHAEILADIRAEVLDEAARSPQADLGRAVGMLATRVAPDDLVGLITSIGDADEFDAWIADGLPAAGARLCERLAIDPDDNRQAIEQEMLESPHLPRSEWEAIAEVLATGSSQDRDRGAALAEAASAQDPAERLAAWLDVFLTQSGTRRKGLITKPLAAQYPDLAVTLEAEALRLEGLVARHRAVDVRDRTMALATVAAEVTARYRSAKAMRGLLDFDDLVRATNALLSRVEAAWVLHKLDLGIDHILIDEAQDTSPDQWRIVEALVDEFVAGDGARPGVTRTIFAVGDEKQSIFSFQGADPTKFDEMRRIFEGRFTAAGLSFSPVTLDLSFRSTPAVLAAVDSVFARPEAWAGLTADPAGPPGHVAIRADVPGFVEIWPPEKPAPKDTPEPWAPVDAEAETSPRLRLARRIAETVRIWLDRGEPLPGRGRPLGPGDVMVLVRSRNPLFSAIIKSLKDCGVPVAGADRLDLSAHIATRDIVALADVLLTREDDLALATVLKSPLFGFDDDDLFRLAHGRPGSLADALAASADPRDREADARLAAWREEAGNRSPFDLLGRLLGSADGVTGLRRRMIARLGPEAADVLDEVHNLALVHESTGAASLRRFAHDLAIRGIEIKRDMDVVRDEVRVMTAHGAKGLEAPVVILADTMAVPEGPRASRILPLGEGPGRPLAWAKAKAEDPPALLASRTSLARAAAEESRRLLYVAMTRAEDRLIVCGAEPARGRPPGCWYDLIEKALSPLSTEEPADDGSGMVLRFRKGETGQGEAVAGSPMGHGEVAEPDWLRKPVAPCPVARRRRASSGSVAFDPVSVQRGQLLHRLMQVLADLRADVRAERGARLLGAADVPPSAADALLEEALGALALPEMQPFLDGGRSEVAVQGIIGRPGGPPLDVTGRVDRLVIAPDAIRIVDYKTDRCPPDEAPEAYLTQLALYATVLGSLAPGRAVTAALLWTAVPRLDVLPRSELAVALARLDAVRGGS